MSSFFCLVNLKWIHAGWKKSTLSRVIPGDSENKAAVGLHQKKHIGYLTQEQLGLCPHRIILQRVREVCEIWLIFGQMLADYE